MHNDSFRRGPNKSITIRQRILGSIQNERVEVKDASRIIRAKSVGPPDILAFTSGTCIIEIATMKTCVICTMKPIIETM